VIFIVGALAVDVGLWLSEKRGAQTDADFPALAGAWELLPQVGNAATAQTAVDDWATDNDETANLVVDNVVIDDSCFNQGTDDAVAVDVTHGSRSLFFSIFGIVDDPDIQAHAKACAGAAQGVGNIVPFQIDDNPGPCFDANEQPVFASFCPLELGAQGGNPRGMLDLEAPGGYCSDTTGSGSIEDLIEWGAPGTCLISTSTTCDPANNGPWYECVGVQTGNPQKVLNGTNARLLRDGDCDASYGDGDGIDEFDETLELQSGSPTTGVYLPRDCDAGTDGVQISPRLVTIVVLEEDPPTNAGNTGFPILAFAGFYLSGCTPEGVPVDSQDDVDPDCDPNFSAPGHSTVWGQFMKLILSGGGGVGPPNDQTTIFGISLVE